jgi:hypothetical protein
MAGFQVSTYGRFWVSTEDTANVLLAVSFPDMSSTDRFAYRDTEHYDFESKYGGEFPRSSEDDAEHYHGKVNGVEWWARLYDYRPNISGTVVKSRHAATHPLAGWRRQYLVQLASEEEKVWLPAEKVEPDSAGTVNLLTGTRVWLTLTVNDEGVTEIARVRPIGSRYGSH